MPKEDKQPEAADQPEPTEDQLPQFDKPAEIPDHIIGQEIKDKPGISGQAEPKDGPGAEPKAQEDKAQPEDSTGGPETDGGDEPEGYGHAVEVLKRAKFSPSLIERMSQQEVMDQADVLRPIQAQSDTMSREYARLRNDFEQLRGEAEQKQKQDAQPDLSLFSDDLSAIRSELGDEQAKAFESILAKQAKSHQDQFSQLQQTVQQMEVARFQRDLAGARESLLSEFPRLKSKDYYDRVLARAKSLYSASDANERYGNEITSVMRDAAVLELGPAVSKEDQQKLVDEHQNRRESQSTVGGAAETGKTAKTREELQYEAFCALEDGDHEKEKRLKKELGLPNF